MVIAMAVAIASVNRHHIAGSTSSSTDEDEMREGAPIKPNAVDTFNIACELFVFIGNVSKPIEFEGITSYIFS